MILPSWSLIQINRMEWNMECVHTYKLEWNMVKKIKYMYVNGGRQNSWERKKKREERKCVFWHQNSWMQSKISKYSADAITRFRNVLGLRDSCLIFNHSAIRQQKIRSYVCFKPDAMVSIFQKISHCLLQDCSIFIQNTGYTPVLYQEILPDIDGSAQDCSNSTASALELLQSCTKPLMWWYPERITSVPLGVTKSNMLYDVQAKCIFKFSGFAPPCVKWVNRHVEHILSVKMPQLGLESGHQFWHF